jgi:Molybdopterin-binding domain of aldehyde dehydrogenase
VTQAAEKVIEELKKRAAVMWEISADAVEWKDGKVYPAGSKCRQLRAGSETVQAIAVV